MANKLLCGLLKTQVCSRSERY